MGQNTDRFYTSTIPPDTPRGTVLIDQMITTTMGARLARQANLYQQYTVNKLSFEIQTQTATTRPGGYVVAITNDPSVLIGTGITALQTANAMDGTITSKMWQSTIIHFKPDGRKFYCTAGEDPRLFSPGKLVLITDGTTDAPVDITVIMHWDITFYHAIRTPVLALLPQAVVTASYLYTGNESVRYTNWDPTTGTNDPALNAANSAYLENAIAGLPPIDTIGPNILWYLLPSPVPINNVEEGLVISEHCFFISIRVSDGHLQGVLHVLPSDQYIRWGTNTTLIMVQNSVLTPVTPSEYSGNAAVSFLARARKLPSANQQLMISKEYQEMPLQNLQKRLTPVQSKLEQLSNELARLSVIQ